MPPPTGRFASTNPYASSASPAASTQDLLVNEKPNAAMMQVPASPYGSVPGTPGSGHPFLGSTFSLAADPQQWGANLSMQDREPDDDLHNPDPRRDHRIDRGGTICTGRGILNLGCLAILSLGLLMLFAGYPLLSYFLTKPPPTNGGFNIGGVNASGQFPDMEGNFGLIDKDTPPEAYTRKSIEDGSEWDLVFSDEFNTDGRSFYPGDDPYWEATDLHYWGTNNLECFVGRAAPEIDMFEAQVSGNYVGHVSQSGQWAPFNYAYHWFNTSENIQIYNETITELNEYVGGAYQQSTSGVTITNQECYSGGGGCYAVYGFEYKPGYDGYITWVNDNKPSWTVRGAGMGPDPRVELTGGRPVPVEPMYLIVNLGISPNFGAIDWDNLVFPNYMLVDWIRVYQPKDAHNIGCDPPDFPTADYINTFIEAYTNPNLTTWVDDYGQVIPKNRLIDNCT
ncbi:hypothetical protein FRC06_001478 [Ceratobasidium sp. 370]|nr:hypothetical protein FRC06_001478 [Ceratobasidium sp. 370]